MKFGLPLFGLGPRHYASVAQHAEQNGFESVWMPEHLVLPASLPATYPYSDTGTAPISADAPLYDPWVVLGALAAVTERIRLGTAVYILPLRHPIATARSVVTVDRLSGGRVTLGAGVGWLEAEFEAAGQSFSTRGRRMDEIMVILRRLWTEDVIEHAGEFYDFGPVKFAPKTLQKANIPIEIGGSSPAALRRAGWLGDGWLEIGSRHLAQVGEQMAVIDGHRADAGRSHLPFEFTVGVGTDPDVIRAARDLGVTRLMVGPTPTKGRPYVDDVREFVERFADQVIAHIA